MTQLGAAPTSTRSSARRGISLPPWIVRHERAISFGLVALLSLILWAPRLTGPIDIRYDAGVYYVLGTSLAKGEGYRLLNEPGNPVGIQYPPGLPAIVAAHQRLLGTTDANVVAPVLRRTYAVLFVALAFATLALGRRFAGRLGGLATSFIFLLQANTLLLSDLLFTEVPFTLLSIAAVFLLLSPWFHKRPVLRESLGFLLVAGAFLLRTAGLAMLCAWVFEALMKRQWKLVALRVVLAAIPFAGWQAHVMNVRSGEQYKAPAYSYQRAPYQYYNVSYAENLVLVDPFKPELGWLDAMGAIRRLGANLIALPVGLGEVVSQSTGFWGSTTDWLLRRKVDYRKPPLAVVYVPLLLLAILSVVGLLTLGQRREWFIVGLCVASIGLICTTPWQDQFLRYLAPLCPFLALCVVVGVIRLKRWAVVQPNIWVKRSVLGGLFALMGLSLFVQAYSIRNCFFNRYHSPSLNSRGRYLLSTPKWFYHNEAWSEWNSAIRWVAAQAPANAVVATSAPHLCYIRTGMKSILPPMESNPVELRRLLEEVPVAYAIVDELNFIDISARYLRPALEADPANWTVVHRVKNTLVYAYIGSRSPMADSP